MALAKDLSQVFIAGPDRVHRIDLEATPPSLDPVPLFFGASTGPKVLKVTDNGLLVVASGARFFTHDIASGVTLDSAYLTDEPYTESFSVNAQGELFLSTIDFFAPGRLYRASISKSGMFEPSQPIDLTLWSGSSVSFSPNGGYAMVFGLQPPGEEFVCNGGDTYFVDAQTNTMNGCAKLAIPGQYPHPPGMLFHPSGRHVFVRSAQSVRAFEVDESGLGRQTLEIPTHPVFLFFQSDPPPLALSHAGSKLYIIQPEIMAPMSVHDARTGALIHEVSLDDFALPSGIVAGDAKTSKRQQMR